MQEITTRGLGKQKHRTYNTIYLIFTIPQ